MPIRAVVTDIEGTTTPIAFVKDVLFPYARLRLPAFLSEHAADADVLALLQAVRATAPGEDPQKTLLAWMDADAKITPLKTLQGLIWDEGYVSGALRGALYPDVAPVLRRLREGGRRLYVYSSGSVHAQRLIFGHSVAGDLTPLFDDFFDTAIGGKRESRSYRAIASRANLPGGEMLFVSDIAEELDAAQEAGFATCQLVRPQDGTKPAGRFAQATSFDALPL